MLSIWSLIMSLREDLALNVLERENEDKFCKAGEREREIQGWAKSRAPFYSPLLIACVQFGGKTPLGD